MKHHLIGMFVAPAILCAALPACSRHAPAPGAEASAALPELTVDQVEAMSAKGELDVYDANGASRYKRGHVPGAKWVRDGELTPDQLPADKARAMVFYCSNEH